MAEDGRQCADLEGPLGFEPIDLEQADLPALCAYCAIDHAVGPVPLTRGGAEKFLDKLLIWREIAHSFCFHHEDRASGLARLDRLPDWARDSLRAQPGDHREAEYDWERLARGETDDALWDAVHRPLLIHGELHNNLRMAWGKAIQRWTRSPERALELMVDLNHRYALDGSDPNSYGGLLDCLGLFDRSFSLGSH